MAAPLMLICLVLLAEALRHPDYRDAFLRLSLVCAVMAGLVNLL